MAQAEELPERRMGEDAGVFGFSGTHNSRAFSRLSNPPASSRWSFSYSTLSRLVLEHERETGEMVPRRGTIHDLGRSVSHKAIICYKHLVEHKPTSQVAQETFHSPEDVERYVQCLRRIQLCRDSGLSPEETAQATGHSL